MIEKLKMVIAVLDSIQNYTNTIIDALKENPLTDMTFTVVAGVLVYVICEWLKEVWLTPLQEFKKLRAKTSHHLVLYARYYANPIIGNKPLPDEYEEASLELRKLASEVTAFAEVIPIFHPGIPAPNDIVEAGKDLIGLSNSMTLTSSDTFSFHIKHTEMSRENIKRLLLFRIYRKSNNKTESGEKA